MSIASQSLPPFSRDQPAPIAVSRFDGRRIVDGAGLSSVGINFPQRIQYDDPLADLRSSLLTIVRNKHLDAAVRCLREDAIPAPIIAQVESNFVAALPDVEHAFRSFFTQHSLSADFVPETICGESQTFRCSVISALAEFTNDIDPSAWAEIGANGVTLGLEGLTDTRNFPERKEKEGERAAFEQAQHAPFGTPSRPYRSFLENSSLAQEVLSDHARNDFVYGPVDWPTMRSWLELPDSVPEPDQAHTTSDDIACARMGAVPKQDTVRVVTDETVNTVNDRVILPETMQTPGAADVDPLLAPEVPDLIGLQGDVAAAFHRLIMALLCRRKLLFSVRQREWFCWKVNPFGTKSSGHWWIRGYSVIHRLTHRLFSSFLHGGFFYVDDFFWQFLADGSSGFSCFEIFAVLILFQFFLGVPYSWKKFRLGRRFRWTGYEVRFDLRRITISDDRLHEYQALAEKFLSCGPQAALIKDLESIACKLSWASQIFPMSKAFLPPLFALVHNPAFRTHLPQGGAFLRPVFEIFFKVLLVSRDWPPPSTLRTSVTILCRVDASASGDSLVIGGWFADSLDARRLFDVAWFCFDVPLSLFRCTGKTESGRQCAHSLPCEIHRRGAQHSISAGDCLASAVAIALWGHRFHSASCPYVVSLARLDTDSMVTSLSTKIRWFSNSLNLQQSLQTLVHCCLHQRVHPILSHCKGEVNVLADAITRFRELQKAPTVARLPQHRRALCLPEIAGTSHIFSALSSPSF